MNPPPLSQVVSEWSQSGKSLRLGQYFMNKYCAPDYRNSDLFYSETALVMLEEMYRNNQWPLN